MVISIDSEVQIFNLDQSRMPERIPEALIGEEISGVIELVINKPIEHASKLTLELFGLE